MPINVKSAVLQSALLRCATASAFWVLGTPAMAQLEQRAFFAATPSLHRISVEARKDLKVKMDTTTLNDLKQFQVRLFSGTRTSLSSQRELVDGCLEYDSAVFPHPTITKNGSVRDVYVTGTSRGWLGTTDGPLYTERTWVIVFESGFPTGVAPTMSRLRLRPQDAEKYFARGIEIVVVPDAAVPSLEVQREVELATKAYQLARDQQLKSGAPDPVLTLKPVSGGCFAVEVGQGVLSVKVSATAC